MSGGSVLRALLAGALLPVLLAGTAMAVPRTDRPIGPDAAAPRAGLCGGGALQKINERTAIPYRNMFCVRVFEQYLRFPNPTAEQEYRKRERARIAEIDRLLSHNKLADEAAALALISEQVDDAMRQQASPIQVAR